MTGHFDKDILAFKDMLVKKGIRKVNVSGFKNGSDGHVKIPESLIGEEHELLFVKCSAEGIPMKTEKFVSARAKGAVVVSNKFLLK